jgi:hypothetical protein
LFIVRQVLETRLYISSVVIISVQNSVLCKKAEVGRSGRSDMFIVSMLFKILL